MVRAIFGQKRDPNLENYHHVDTFLRWLLLIACRLPVATVLMSVFFYLLPVLVPLLLCFV